MTDDTAGASPASDSRDGVSQSLWLATTTTDYSPHDGGLRVNITGGREITMLTATVTLGEAG